jgi:hypothetical protein
MKQAIDLTTADPRIVTFITHWKQKKGYSSPDQLLLGEVIELLIATTRNLHHEDGDGRFFNHLLTNNESSVGWDGQELIDILYYEVQEALKKLFSNSRVLPET